MSQAGTSFYTAANLISKLMAHSRKHKNAGVRCPGHDYRSKCIYHIVLNKAEGFPLFSEVTGSPGSLDFPPSVSLHPAGEIIHSAISALKSEFPFTSVLRRCIMPDHVHFALYVREATDTHLDQIITHLKRLCSEAWESHGNPPETDFFLSGYHDTFLSGNDQLQVLLNYISDNPRRHLIRTAAPGWFRRFRISDGSSTYEAYGNWDLLCEPNRTPVRFSRKYSESELLDKKREWHRAILNDGILVSPFIHPTEKAVRDWGMRNGAAIIYITHKPFPDRYKPQGELFDLCAEGRLLIVHIPQSEKSMEYIKENGKPPYAACQKMNAVAVEIATGLYEPVL